MTAKLNCVLFSLAAVCGVAVRTVMLLFTVDPSSGFIKAEYAYSAVGFVVFLVAAAALVFVSAMLVPTVNKPSVRIDGIPFYISCLVMSAAFIYETFFSSIMTGVSAFQQTLQIVFTVLSAGSLICIAICKFLGKDFPAILSLSPVLFWIMRLIIVFTGFSTISTISDTVIETAGMCLALATFLFYAKAETSQPTRRQRLYFATSLLCSFVCIIGSVPRINADIASVEQSVHLNTVPTFTALATALFSGVFAYRLLAEIKK